MASRYNFSISSKTKYNQNPQNFFVLWFTDDEKAKAFAAWAEETILPDYQKLSVSRLIRQAPSSDIPTGANLTDMYTARMLFGSTTSSDKRTNATLPLKPGVDVSVISQYLTNSANGFVFSDDTPIDRLISTQLTGRNIVAGGPVSA